MSSLYTAYTPLESLLLFQALRTDGVSSTSFNRISDQLKSIPLIRNDPTYDSGRLSPDALRELYVTLLKGEAKQDLERKAEKEDQVTNGAPSPGSRKRKAPSPARPTVQDAAQHSHLIPQLVTRLYVRYREKTVRDLREYERSYITLARDVGEIEAGEWDERLQRQRSVSAARSPRPSTSAHTQLNSDHQDYSQPSKTDRASPTSLEKPPETSALATQKRYSQAKIDAVINHDPEPQESPGGHQRAPSITTLPPLSEMAPRSPQFGIPPKIPGPVPPLQHVQQPGGRAYDQSPPSGHQSPYAPPHAHPASSLQVQTSFPRPLSSPRHILPPPAGMTLPMSNAQHVGSPSLHGPPRPSQQYYQPPHRGSAAPSPTGDGHPRGYPPPQLPSPQGYYQHQPPYPDRRTSYPPPQIQNQPSYSTHPTQVGGYQLQPFSINTASQSSKLPPKAPGQQHMPASLQSPARAQAVPPYAQYQPNAPATAPRQRPASNPLVHNIIAALATPPRQPQRPAPLWKPEDVPTPPAMQVERPRPDVEPMSPTQERIKPTTRSGRSTRSTAALEVPEPQKMLQPSARRRRPPRDRSPYSVTSSTTGDPHRARTRSQSVSTATGGNVPIEDRPISRDNVKPEPSTPAPTIEEPESLQDPTTASASGPMTRKRRGTLQSQAQLPPKRKRGELSSEQGADDLISPSPRAMTITATRNFAKTSATIMNDINSHKHASYFAGPVRDKDASGYSEIIKQPQNLKSIRAAINAGTRATAAAATMDSPSATPSALALKNADSSATIELERTVDLIPPKAIVNGAQLEKEVYRMLANAVMFNPGDDGLVQDTREMFGDVEAKIQEWRGAEREVGADEEDDGRVKRRKL